MNACRSAGELGEGCCTLVSGGIERSVGEHISVGASYARIDGKDGSALSTERRPSADVVLNWKLSGMGVQNRSRLGMRSGAGDRALRYRRDRKSVV